MGPDSKKWTQPIDTACLNRGIRPRVHHAEVPELHPNLLFLQLRGHRNIRFEYLGHWAAALGVFGGLLESGLIGIRYPADHI